MNRADIRAALLLLGFRHGTKRIYQYVKYIPDSSGIGYMLIHVVIYPYWFIGVVSDYGIKNFISATKAWRYIQSIIGE